MFIKIITGRVLSVFHNFFGVAYWLSTRVYKNKEYPIFSSIISIALYQFLTLLVLFYFVFYQILNRRDLILDESKIFGYIVITIILGLNFYYFQHLNKAREAINGFNNLPKRSKLFYKITFISYTFLIVGLLIGMAYSIRNNIYWF